MPTAERSDLPDQRASGPTALVLLVLGCGVREVDGVWTLTAASAARVDAALRYVAANEAAFVRGADQDPRPRIVFSGGWPGRHRGVAAPPPGCREGDLMLGRARAAGLDRYADLRSETRSTTTLENLLHILEGNLFAGFTFHPGQPLGVVSHSCHLPRVRFLAARVLRLPVGALLEIPARDPTTAGRRWSPRLLHVAARLCHLGVRDPAALLRRERRILGLLGPAVRLARRRHGHRRCDASSAHGVREDRPSTGYRGAGAEHGRQDR